MKEVTFRIPDDTTELITELIEKLGGHVERKPEQIIKAKESDKRKIKTKAISPTFLFAKWKDLDLNPVTYRDKLWPKKEL